MSKFLEPIELPEQASPGTPASGYLTFYAKTDGLYYKRDDGVEFGPLSTGGGDVTTNTAQTITGAKTFTSPLTTQLVYQTAGTEAPLKKFHEALALTNFEACDILSIGASIDEGYYAVTDDERYIAQVRKALQARFNPSSVRGGEGYIPARHVYTGGAVNGYAGQPQRWTFGGGWTLQGNWTYGIGRRYTMLDSGTETASITFTGDRFWLLYIRGTSTGAFTVTIDGGAPVTVDSYAAVLSTGLYDSGQLTRGSHTVVIQPSAGTAHPNGATRLIGLDGIMLFDGDGGASAGTGKGVRWWDSGHSGYKAIDFNNTTWMTGLSHVQPDLITIHFGGNEYLLASSSASFDTNLRGLIAKLRAQVTSNPSILLVKTYDLSDLTGYTPIEPWANYEAVIHQVAADLGCAILDLGERMSSAPAASGSNLFAENIHPNPAGHLALAHEVSEFLVSDRVTKVSLAQFNVSGTADSTTFLRGDGTWTTVAAGTAANVVTSTAATAHKMTVSVEAAPPANPAVGDIWTVMDANAATMEQITIESFPFSHAGNITVKTGTFKLPVLEDSVIEGIQITAGTPSAGAPIIVDVNRNGTTMYTTQANRPMLGATEVLATAVLPDVTALSAGDYLTVDIDQIGSTTAGADVLVLVRLRRV